MCEGPKPQNSMISGFSTPREPSFMDFNIQKYFKAYQKDGHMFRTYYSENHKFEKCWKCVYIIFEVSEFEILLIWKFEMGTCDNLEIGNVTTNGNFENWELEISRI